MEATVKVPSEDLQAFVYGYLSEFGPSPHFLMAYEISQPLPLVIEALGYLGVIGAVNARQIYPVGELAELAKKPFFIYEAIVDGAQID